LQLIEISEKQPGNSDRTANDNSDQGSEKRGFPRLSVVYLAVIAVYYQRITAAPSVAANRRKYCPKIQ
jgi:hypothetical protein